MNIRSILFFFIFTGFNVVASDQPLYASFLKDELIAKPLSTITNLKKFKLRNYYKLQSQRVLSDNRSRHLQTSLNLFKKEKYSLLLKSMISFEKAYGKKADLGWHDYFQISILEQKIKDPKQLADQVLKISSQYLNEKKHSYNDYNLTFSMYRVSLKYLFLKKSYKELEITLARYKKLATKIKSEAQQDWIKRVMIEDQISQGVKIEQIEFEGLSNVYMADYKLYFELTSSDAKRSQKLRTYATQRWDEYTPSLIGNLLYASILLEDFDNIRFYKSKYLEQVSRLSRFELQNTAFQVLFQLPGEEKRTVSSKKNSKESKESIKLRVVDKLISFNSQTIFMEAEREVFTSDLEILLYKKRIHYLIKKGSSSEILSYIKHIPLFKFSLTKRGELLKLFEDKMFDIYKEAFNSKKLKRIRRVTNHWKQTTVKAQLVKKLKPLNQVLLGKLFAFDFEINKDLYFSFLNKISKSEIIKIEAFRHFHLKNYARVISLFKSNNNIVRSLDENIIYFISLAQISSYKASERIGETIFLSKHKIPEYWKQDFYMNYLRVIKSTMSEVDFFKKLKNLKLSIFDGSVEMPRVKEYTEFELIGLNMTLKQSSFEENLKNVNIFLKNYPRSKFYSTLVVTRAKILAQLNRIKESMEALQEVITKTTEKKVKLEALNELSILKIR